MTNTNYDSDEMAFIQLAEREIRSGRINYQPRFIPFWLVIAAYLDCCRHKRSKHACILFNKDALKYLELLWKELDTQTYEIGYSNAFIVTRPKLREVFAADFRDRIAHHLLMLLAMDVFENNFIPDSYNCRKGKGTLYGILRVRDMILEMSNNYTEDCYILKCDMKGFFMHINKDIMWNTVSQVIKDGYNGSVDLDWILWLTKMIIYHRPELKCHINSPKDMWLKLDPDKSLFTNGENLGMAIGNLTSQIFANTYLTPFDKFVTANKDFRYGRYVDDFVIVCKDKRRLLRFINEAKAYLKKNMGIDLHPNKIYIQEVKKGVSFTGGYIKYGQIYPTNRLYGNFERFLREPFNGDIEKFVARYNSYMGFLKQSPTYNYRKRMFETKLSSEVKRMTKIKNGYSTLVVLNRFNKRKQITRKLFRNTQRQFARMDQYMNPKLWAITTTVQSELRAKNRDNVEGILKKKNFRRDIFMPSNESYRRVFVSDADSACYVRVY